MSRSRIRGWRFSAVTVAAVAIAAPLLGAQASNSVPDMLGQIITMLQSMQLSLDGLSHATESNVRITPPTVVSSTFGTTPVIVRCVAVNTASEPQGIQIDLIDGFTGITRLAKSVSVQPLQMNFVFLEAPGQGFPWVCRFTVLNGTRSDIRAHLEVLDPAVSYAVLSVPAE